MLDMIHHLHWPILTPWKIIGFLGVGMFAGRWFVQAFASRRAGKPVMTRLFWIMSLMGSLLCLSYFVFGKNDAVGIVSYLFPSTIACYNLMLDSRHRKKMTSLDAESASNA